MAVAKDAIEIPQLVMRETGAVLTAGWYDVQLSQIDAVYKVTTNDIEIQSDGDMTGSVDLDVLSDAPEHYDIANKGFTGVIELDGQTLKFVNNCITNAQILDTVS